MAVFGLGNLAYFCLLLVNAVAVLSADRFLAPLGLTSSSASASSNSAPNFGQAQSAYGNGFESYGVPSGNVGGGEKDGPSVKMRAIMLVDAIRTLMRSERTFLVLGRVLLL